MGKKSRQKGKRGEREFTKESDGIRTWWSADEHSPDAAHDVWAHERPWEVKLLKTGLSVAYKALEEFEAHELAALAEDDYVSEDLEFRPIVAARMDRKPWIVIQYYEDWRAERAN